MQTGLCFRDIVGMIEAQVLNIFSEQRGGGLAAERKSPSG